MPMLGNVRRHRRRRHYRNNNPALVRGLPSFQSLSTLVATGVGSGLLVGWGAPRVAAYFNIAPAGFMYRGMQFGLTVAGAWALRRFRVISPGGFATFVSVGGALAALGAIQDWQRGLLAIPGVRGGGGPPAVGDAYGDELGQYEDSLSAAGEDVYPLGAAPGRTYFPEPWAAGPELAGVGAYGADEANFGYYEQMGYYDAA